MRLPRQRWLDAKDFIMLEISYLQERPAILRSTAIWHQVQRPFHQKRNQLPSNPKMLLIKHLANNPTSSPAHYRAQCMAFEGISRNNSGRLLPLSQYMIRSSLPPSQNERLRPTKIKSIFLSAVSQTHGLIASRIGQDVGLLIFWRVVAVEAV